MNGRRRLWKKRLRYQDGEQALAAAKKAIKGHPSFRFHRHKLEDGTDCFEVVEDNKVLERHIVIPEKKR